MRALQLLKPRLFQTVDIARPEIGGDQILVRLQGAVLCGSDIPKFTGMWRGLQYPLPPGMPIHECVGVVAESRSPRFHVGDWAVAVPRGDQGLAEYYAADAIKAIVIPEPLVHSEASLLIQPLSTTVYGVEALGDVTGRTAAVVGLGPIGLLVTWLLHQRGARVTGVDPISWRCEAAQRLGAERTVELHSERLVAAIRQGDEWEPADIVVETVGQQTRTINDCLYLVKRRGQVLALGVPLEPVYPFEYMRFFRQNVDLIASVTPPDETYMIRASELIAGHEQELASLITHRFTPDQVADAYALYETRTGDRPLKVMIDGTHWPEASGKDQG